MIECQPLFRGKYAARKACAHHEAVSGLQFAPAPLVAQVPIILLVAAVEFQQLVVIVADGARDRVAQPLFNGAAQKTAVAFDVLEVGEWGSAHFSLMPSLIYIARIASLGGEVVQPLLCLGLVPAALSASSTAERRVGKECVSTCRFRGL